MDLAHSIDRRSLGQNHCWMFGAVTGGDCCAVEAPDENQDTVALNSVVLTVTQSMPVTKAGVSLLIALLALSALSLSRKR